jgi:KDO2-lipid IV(A) lauroyltransferase
VRRQLNLYGERILGRLVKWLIRLLRCANPDRASDFCGSVARRIGPYLPVHRIGQANLRAAFPDKDAAWIEATLRESWDNLGRVAGEYVHMARIWDFDPARPDAGRIQTDSVPLFDQLRLDGQPALCFAAHLALMAYHRPWFTGCRTTRRWRARSSAFAHP